jgi:hypothetical protein
MPKPVAGQLVRRRDGSTPTIREVLYVAAGEVGAVVYLNQEFTMTEIAWITKEPTKKNPEGSAGWVVAVKERGPRNPKKRTDAQEVAAGPNAVGKVAGYVSGVVRALAGRAEPRRGR